MDDEHHQPPNLKFKRSCSRCISRFLSTQSRCLLFHSSCVNNTENQSVSVDKFLETNLDNHETSVETSIQPGSILPMQAMMTLISPGMNIGFSAVALPLLTQPGGIFDGSENAATWFASIVGMAAPFGCLLGTFSMKSGRKVSMAIVGYVCAVGWLVTSFANGVPQILIGRFIVGIGTGLVTAPAIVYISEISNPQYRLGLVNGASLFLALGVLIIYTLGCVLSSWRLQAAISTIIPILSSSSILLILPESPIWLLHNKQKLAAKESLMKLRGLKCETLELNEELAEMQNYCSKKFKDTEVQAISLEQAAMKGLSENVEKSRQTFDHVRAIGRIALLPEVWKPFLILNSLFFFQHFCGINVIIAYTVQFVSSCGFDADPFIFTTIIGVIQLLGSGFLVCTSYRLGVRKISLTSATGMTISLGLLGIYLQFIKPVDVHETYRAVPIICIFAFVAMGSYGLIAVPWSMLGELYPTQYVHYLAPLTTCISYIFHFTTLHIYPLLIRHGILPVVYTYCAISMITTIFIALALPETQGIAHHDIVANFQKK